MFELCCEILRIFFWNGSAAPNLFVQTNSFIENSIEAGILLANLFVHANTTAQWGPNWRKVLIYGQNWISGL